MKTQDLANNAKPTGLEINVAKTKVMCINTKLDTPITIDDSQVECVNEFTYLGSTISTTIGAQRNC